MAEVADELRRCQYVVREPGREALDRLPDRTRIVARSAARRGHGADRHAIAHVNRTPDHAAADVVGSHRANDLIDPARLVGFPGIRRLDHPYRIRSSHVLPRIDRRADRAPSHHSPSPTVSYVVCNGACPVLSRRDNATY